jgi:hypothetical protein
MGEKQSAEGLKAFSDAMRQIITLSTGIIALTVTFLEKVIQPTAPSTAMRSVPWTMFWAWVVLGVTIVLALWTLLAVAGSLDALDRTLNGLPLEDKHRRAVEKLVMASNVRVPALLTIVAFLAGVGFTIATGFMLA